MTQFPDGFVWGAATSAYQVEGSPLADGAGPSIWHRYSHIAGNTRNGDTGDRACDHYNRMTADVTLMAQLGLQSYRFSIAWSRILPSGRGTTNPKGIDFYSRLVDTLLEHGIMPNATLYHWDLPAALDDDGGWLNPDIADWFGDYASVMYRALGDRVPMWATLNEPWVVMHAGYVVGAHAPGHSDWRVAPRVAHNLLRAHGRAVQTYRADTPRGRIGIVVNLEPKYAASDSPADIAATERADAYFNRQFLDPVLLGEYPPELRDIFGTAWLEPSAEDLALIRQPIDFVGINYYKRAVVCDDPSDIPVGEGSVRQPQHVHTELDWEVYPPALTRVLLDVRDRYDNPPVYITENGAAFADPDRAPTSGIQDHLRTAYLRDHLQAVARAIHQGADVRGYYAWSLLDNFEWSEGFSKRFGIVHVDFDTLERTPKSSAAHYSSIIQDNGAMLVSGL